MKAYIASIDWADEGDIFFFSLESEERLQAMKELIDIFDELDLGRESEMYWGTNEAFEFGPSDFLKFINEAVDISEEELAVFNKFRVTGFDIYGRIADELYEWLVVRNWNSKTGWHTYIPEHLTQDDLDRIKPVFLRLYGLEDWNEVQTLFAKQNQ